MGAIVTVCCELGGEEKMQQQMICRHAGKAQTTEDLQKGESQEVRKQQQRKTVIMQYEEQEQFFDIEEENIVMLQQRKEHKKDQIKRLKVIGLLGEGSFGRVYLVRKQNNSKKEEELYAMKQINRYLTNSKKVMESLLIQRKVLQNADSRFIVSLKYAFANRKNLYLIMQYAQCGDVSRISKGDLRQTTKQSREQIIKFIMACVVSGLEQLHKMKIIYRDLKPQNILIFGDGYVKLSDFGLAKHLQGDKKCQTVAGTLLYNAPQIVSQTGYDRAIDIWGLGVLLYELSTGQTPFRLQDVSSKLRFRRIAKQEQKNRKWRGHKLEQKEEDLIASLLRFEAKERRGYKDWNQIRQHIYFQGIDWQQLNQAKVLSPLKRLVEKNEMAKRRAVEEGQKDRFSLSSEESWDYKRTSLISEQIQLNK